MVPYLINILKYNDSTIKNEKQHFLHYKSIECCFFQHSRAINSEAKCLIWTEFKLVQAFMPVLVQWLPASLTMIQSKVMGLSC